MKVKKTAVKTRTSDPLEQMRAFASLQCIKKEQYSKFIEHKLKSKFSADKESINEILSWLRDMKILDDKRFTDAFIHDKIFLNRWGVNKIISALRYREIDDKIVLKSVMDVDQEKYRDVAKAVFSDLTKSEKDKMKILKKMLDRGFQYPMVKEIMKEDKSKN